MGKIFQESFFYKLYYRIIGGVTNSAKSSAIIGLIASAIAYLRMLIKNSVIVSLFTSVADRFGAQVRRSVLVNRFLLIKKSEPYSENSVLTRAFYWFLGVSRALTHALKLDRVFNGSIFAKPWIWCGITAAMAPILPTKAIIALVIVGFVSLYLDMSVDRKRLLVFFPINKYICMYALVYLLATFASVSRSDSLYVGAVTVCFVLFFIVFTNSVGTRRQLRGIVIAMVWAGLVVAAYGIVQFMFPDSFSESWMDEDMFDYSFRVYSTLQNPNVLGEYFLLIIPFAFACLITSKSSQGRVFYALCVLLMLVCLVLTYSRGAYIGIILAVAVFLVLLDRRFIFPGIVLAVIAFFAMPTTFIERLLSIGDTTDTSTSYRLFIWLGTIAMLKDYWFCGVGPGQGAYMKVYPVYAYSAISAPHSHNLFLQITCDTGVSGLFLFIAIIYQYFKNMFSSLRRRGDREGRVFVIAGISSVLGFLVQSLTDYSFYNYRVMLLFWIVLGIGLLFTRADNSGETEHETPHI